MLTDDWIQQLFTAANQASLELRYVVVLWLLSLGLWLLRPRWVSVLVLCPLALMQLVHLGHISFLGSPLNAPDLTKLVEDWAEVQESGLASLADHWHIVPAVLLPYGLLAFLLLKVPLPMGRSASWAGGWLVLAILSAKPIAVSDRGLDSFLSGPTRSTLHNSLNAFSYYAVNLAFRTPAPLPDVDWPAYELRPVPTQAAHVWVVVADSLRTSRLSAYGYERNTTPTLKSLHDNGELLIRPGIAAGVTTAVSLPHLLNLAREPGHTSLITEQPYNLFRLARQNGFKTFWMSSQESKLLSHAGSRFLDVTITREDYPAQFLRRHDHAIADLLKNQVFTRRNLVVMNLRSAHLPYEENYDQHTELTDLWPTDAHLPREVRMANAYDNAMRYVDDVLAEIITHFDQLSGERYLVITGDHGQLLGERGQWGHKELLPEVVEVPVMVYARDAPEAQLKAISTDAWVSHFELGQWLAERLGVRIRNPAAAPGEHVNHGNQLFGDKYIQRVDESPAGWRYHAPELLSKWLRREAEQRAKKGQVVPAQAEP